LGICFTAGYITVTNPPPGGGVSSSSFGLVEVHTPTATIVAKLPKFYLKQGGQPFFLVPADFNNDGILDFAVSDGKRLIEARLGNGDGTFRFGSFPTNNYYSASSTPGRSLGKSRPATGVRSRAKSQPLGAL
jgi:hypothetical protein